MKNESMSTIRFRLTIEVVPQKIIMQGSRRTRSTDSANIMCPGNLSPMLTLFKTIIRFDVDTLYHTYDHALIAE